MVEPVVAIVATLDTKAEAAALIQRALADRGIAASTVDCGVGEVAASASVSRSQVLAAINLSEDALSGLATVERILLMRKALGAFLETSWQSGCLRGVVGLGGGRGTSLIAPALQELPWSVPKVLVTTVAAGREGTIVGASNTVLVPSVVDLVGVNRYTVSILSAAASCLAGLLSVTPSEAHGRLSVGISALGATTEVAQEAQTCVLKHGMEPVVFHMSGAGPGTYQRFVYEEASCAVLDLTPADLVDAVFGGMTRGPRDRLSLRRKGVAQVVSSGGLDMIRIAAVNVSTELKEQRKTYVHSPEVTLVRTSTGENRTLGRMFAEWLSRSSGRAILLVPMGGFSAYDALGQPFYDPACAEAFLEGARSFGGPSTVPVVPLDLHINDKAFAEAAVAELVHRL